MIQNKMRSCPLSPWFPSSGLGTPCSGISSFPSAILVFLMLLFSTAAFAGDKIGIDLEWRPITGLGPAPPAETPQAGTGASRTTAPEPGSPGKTWTDPVTGMAFVWVPGGCYQIGCGSWTDNCDGDEKPVHEVCLDGFWMGKYEVTQGQWEKVMGDNPSNFKKGSGYPVEQVSWNDCQKFIDRLNGKSGGRQKFGLPTEAQWEYACRSGGEPEKYAGDGDVDRVAWYSSNSGSTTHEVGTKAPNGLGIYDMSGNVYEWCEDWYGNYSSGSQKNPTGPAGGSIRLSRGGSWSDVSRYVRCGNRFDALPDFRYGGLGFRLMRTN